MGVSVVYAPIPDYHQLQEIGGEFPIMGDLQRFDKAIKYDMPEQFILIPGRTSRQGTTLNEGKYTAGYAEEINTLRMAPEDMLRLELAEGDSVRMWNDIGEVLAPVTAAKGDELPAGMLFISYGDKSSRLMGGETHATGMPDSKALDVCIEKSDN